MEGIDMLWYGSEHFYNQTNTESLLYLKDGKINTMRWYENKIFKPLRNLKFQKDRKPTERREIEDGQTISI